MLRIPPTIQAATEPTLVSAAGQEIELDREIRPDGAGMWISQPLEEPGVYQLTMGSATWPVAVNLPTTESDLRPLAEQSVVAALGDIEIQWMGDELPSEAMAEDENRADFGWSLLLAVLLLAGVECFMAMRFGRHRR